MSRSLHLLTIVLLLITQLQLVPPTTGAAARGSQTAHTGNQARVDGAPGDTAAPTLTLSPKTAPAGTLAQASGTGFAATDVVTLYWGTTVTGSVLAMVNASNGGFTTTFTVPIALPGNQIVTAAGATAK